MRFVFKDITSYDFNYCASEKRKNTLTNRLKARQCGNDEHSPDCSGKTVRQDWLVTESRIQITGNVKKPML